MLKKLLLISVLCIGLIAPLGNAEGGYPWIPGGWGGYVKSVCIWSIWRGGGNFEKFPTEASVTMEPTSIQLHYLNPAGNPGGLGEPFYPDILLEGYDETGEESPVVNGRWYALICFDDELILNSIPPELLPVPPNDGWTIDPESPVVVREMYVTIRGYSDLDGDGDITDETAHIAGPCTLNSDGTEYNCETEESWRWEKKGLQDCPYE